jgi:hypothetical protein
MQTIGRHYHGPRYNYIELCGDCGTMWHRSDLIRDADGNLRCPQCREPETANELLEAGVLNAAVAPPAYSKLRDDQ